jgi:signal transduction histidine kinase
MCLLVVGGDVLGVFVSGQFRSDSPLFEARVRGVIADVKKKHSRWRALKLWYFHKRMPRREQSFVNDVVARLREKAEDLQAILTKYYEDNVKLAENQFLAEISAKLGGQRNLSEGELYNIVLSALIEFTGASSGMLILYDSNQKLVKLWNLENIRNNESAFIQNTSVELPVLEAADEHTDSLIFADDCKAILASLNRVYAGMNAEHLSGLKFALDKHEDVYIILNFNKPVFGIVAGSPFSDGFLPVFAVSLRHQRLWVNQEKLLEEAQQRNKELEYARKAAVDFMRRVTHSISIPQSLVMNLAAYLIESSQRSPRRITEICTDILRGSRLLTQMVTSAKLSSAMDFPDEHARITKEGQESEPIHLGKILEEVADLYEMIGCDRNVSIRVECNFDELPSIKADRLLLWTAFANVIDNAVKYSHKGTEVRIYSERNDRDKTVRISIQDFGLGITLRRYK